MYGLTAQVSRNLGVSDQEANEIISEQASIGLDMMANDRLDVDDVEELMYDMGMELEYLDEFLLRMC